jgi:hypothetical protein
LRLEFASLVDTSRNGGFGAKRPFRIGIAAGLERRTPYYRLNHLRLLAIGPGASGPSQLRARGPGERIWPPSVPGTFVINVGTMLASYSNDRVRMT